MNGSTATTEGIAFPVPADREVVVMLDGRAKPGRIRWMSPTGQLISVPMRFARGGVSADISALPEGLYLVLADSGQIWKVVVALP